MNQQQVKQTIIKLHKLGFSYRHIARVCGQEKRLIIQFATENDYNPRQSTIATTSAGLNRIITEIKRELEI